MQSAMQHADVFKISDFVKSYLETEKSGGSEVIGPEGGIVTVTNPASPIYGTTLKVPAGALETPVRISIAAGEHACDFGLSSSLKLLPDGLRFNHPAILTIHLKNSVETEYDFEKLTPACYHYDSTTGDWTLNSTARLERFGDTVLCELDQL